jgi:hypothetical protein
LAGEAAKQVGEIAQAPMNAVSDVFQHAAAIGSGKSQPGPAPTPKKEEKETAGPAKYNQQQPAAPQAPLASTDNTAANPVAAAAPSVAQNKQLENNQIQAAAPKQPIPKQPNASASTEGFTTQ